MSACEWITNALQGIFLPFQWIGSKMQEAIYPSEEELTSSQIQTQHLSNLLDISKEDPLLRERIKSELAALPPSQQARARHFFPKHNDLLPQPLERKSGDNYTTDLA